MANLKAYGYKGVGLPQPEWSVTDNGRGLLEGTGKIYFDQDNKYPEFAPQRGDSHPNDERLRCYQTEVTFNRNKMGYIESKYVGIADGDMTDIEWTLSGSTQDVSIRFHPDFDDWCSDAGWSGFPSTSYDNTMLILDNSGHFKAFGPDHPKVPDVEQFSVPAGNCKISYYTKSMDWVDYAFGLGKQIGTPPHAPYFLSASDKGLSWLLTATSASQYGTIFKVELDFTLSVLGEPFNKYIYDEL